MQVFVLSFELVSYFSHLLEGCLLLILKYLLICQLARESLYLIMQTIKLFLNFFIFFLFLALNVDYWRKKLSFERF